ncbi:hypothetical protein V1522DRAFT_421581 [Lipomyces starkeyi]
MVKFKVPQLNISVLEHHRITFVPAGYRAFAQMANLTQGHGGSPWGAGTYAGPDGSRQPTGLEKEIAEIQGRKFYMHIDKGY